MGAAVSAEILALSAAAMERIKALVLDSLPSPDGRRAYGRALVL